MCSYSSNNQKTGPSRAHSTEIHLNKQSSIRNMDIGSANRTHCGNVSYKIDHPTRNAHEYNSNMGWLSMSMVCLPTKWKMLRHLFFFFVAHSKFIRNAVTRMYLGKREQFNWLLVYFIRHIFYTQSLNQHAMKFLLLRLNFPFFRPIIHWRLHCLSIDNE